MRGAGVSTFLLRIVGTSSLCGGVLVYQILSTRLLSVVLNESTIIIAISFAMLGMGVATSLMSGVRQVRSDRTDAQLCWIGLLIGVSYVVVLAVIALLNDHFNVILDAAAREGGLPELVATIQETSGTKVALLCGILSLPYFLFGIFIAKLFGTSKPAEFHLLYAADLVGAAAGCLLAVASLDHFGFQGCVAVILIATAGGAAAFGARATGYGTAVSGIAAVATIVVLFVPGAMTRLEPFPAPVLLARNFENKSTMEQGWHVWNAHSRVALIGLEEIGTGTKRNIYAHENGDGWAVVPKLDIQDLTENSSLVYLSVMSDPERVLVLFAGVGADMVAIDAACSGACDISGVEINRQMLDHALASSDPQLREFLDRPNIHMHVAEAREFLERDQTKYDTILLSWWGAGTSHYVGSAGKLSQYMYTKEAFGVLLDHLTPDGIVVIYNGSKAQILATLGAVYAERGLGSLDGDIAILRGQQELVTPAPGEGFLDVLEDMRMVLKPSGFDAQDMARLRDFATSTGSVLVLYPGGSLHGYEVYRDLAVGKDLSAINASLLGEYGVELSVTTDDRPFIDELIPRSNYLSLSALFGYEAAGRSWELTRSLIKIALVLSLFSLVLIAGPLFLSEGPRPSAGNLTRLFYFSAVGTGFMAIEIGLIRKFGLLLGHPSYSISVVLAALILSTGLGSLASRRLAASGYLGEKRAAILIVALVVAITALHSAYAPLLIVMPLPVKAVVVVLILLPLGFLMGQLFPLGLVKAGQEDPQSVPWAWAINGISSTIGSAVAFLLSFPLGFSAMLYAGAAVYATILLMPLRGRTPVAATASG